MDTTGDAAARLREATRLFEQARESFTSVSTPAEYHWVVEDYAGRTVARGDGRIVSVNEDASAICGGVLTGNIAATGLEPSGISDSRPKVLDQSGTDSGTLKSRNVAAPWDAARDPELDAVLSAWPTLPAEIKRIITSIAQATQHV